MRKYALLDVLEVSPNADPPTITLFLQGVL